MYIDVSQNWSGESWHQMVDLQDLTEYRRIFIKTAINLMKLPSFYSSSKFQMVYHQVSSNILITEIFEQQTY